MRKPSSILPNTFSGYDIAGWKTYWKPGSLFIKWWIWLGPSFGNLWTRSKRTSWRQIISAVEERIIFESLSILDEYLFFSLFKFQILYVAKWSF